MNIEKFKVLFEELLKRTDIDVSTIKVSKTETLNDVIGDLESRSIKSVDVHIAETPSADIVDNVLILNLPEGAQGPAGPQGPQGIPGEGAIWTGQGEEIMALEQTTGQAINHTMSQKAITDNINGLAGMIAGNKYGIQVEGNTAGLNLEPIYFVNVNGSFIKPITFDAGYAINVQSITMGGTDITQEARQDGIISIDRVTGNVVITVETASVTDATMFTKRTTANGLQVLNNKALLKGVRGNSCLWKQDAYFGGTITFNDNYGFENESKGTGTAAANIYYNGHFPGYRTTQMNLRNILTAGHIYILTITLKFPNNLNLERTRFIIDQATSDGATPTAIQTYNVTNGEVNITRRIRVDPSGTRLAMKFIHGSTSLNNWIPAGQSGIDFQFRNVNAFDLTAMFGTGNEPTTADFLKMFPLGQYDRTTGIVINNAMASYVSKDSEETTLQNVSLNVPTLTGKLNGEGESVVIFPNGMKSSCNEAVNDTYDEIKQVDGVWKAYKRIGSERATNAISGRYEYEILAQEEVYVLDDQTIPTEITVADQGIEEILPTNSATPTTAPAIMEIQYGAIPSRGLLGRLLGGTKGGGSDEPDYSDGEEITDYEEEQEPNEDSDEPIVEESLEEPKEDIKESPVVDEKKELKK